VADKVALGQVSVRVLRFFPVSVIAPTLHAHLHVNTAAVRRTSWRRPGTFTQSDALAVIGEQWIRKFLDVVILSQA